jgi:arsenite methyltransferase
VTAEPYSSPAMRVATGETVRPGGLDLTRRALTFCAFTPGESILDIGCGSGATVRLMRHEFQLDARGIDPSEAMIARGTTEDPALTVTLGDAMNLQFEDGLFDGAIMECALSITPDPRKVLEEACRVLKSGGRLILTDMYLLDDHAPISCSDATAAALCLRNAGTRAELESRLAEAGLRLILFEDHKEHLKRLAVDIIMKFGSLARFLAEVSGDPSPPDASAASASFRGLSYYLAIAQKS